MLSTPHMTQDVLIRLLREVRKEQHLNQETLSERLGKHRTYVTKYESGDRRLDVFELFAICRELNLDIHAVVDAVQAKAAPLVPERSEFMLGFAKGYLIANGYTVSGGLELKEDA